MHRHGNPTLFVTILTFWGSHVITTSSMSPWVFIPGQFSLFLGCLRFFPSWESHWCGTRKNLFHPWILSLVVFLIMPHIMSTYWNNRIYPINKYNYYMLTKIKLKSWYLLCVSTVQPFYTHSLISSL
jgi:hypothetical protein